MAEELAKLVELRQEVRQLRLLVKGFGVVAILLLALFNAQAIAVLPKLDKILEDMMGTTHPTAPNLAIAYGHMANGALPWLVLGLLTAGGVSVLLVSRRGITSVLIACGVLFLLGAHWTWIGRSPEAIFTPILQSLSGGDPHP